MGWSLVVLGLGRWALVVVVLAVLLVVVGGGVRGREGAVGGRGRRGGLRARGLPRAPGLLGGGVRHRPGPDRVRRERARDEYLANLAGGDGAHVAEEQRRQPKAHGPKLGRRAPVAVGSPDRMLLGAVPFVCALSASAPEPAPRVRLDWFGASW